jgi:hypothetical protein
MTALLLLGGTRTIQLIAERGWIRRSPNNDEWPACRLVTAIAPGAHFVKGVVEFRLVLCFYSLAK